MEKIAVIGLGYVGLPVALAFGHAFKDVVGFDINPTRIKELQKHHDSTGEVSPDEFKAASILFTDKDSDLRDATFFVVTVPTPVDQHQRPDLRPVESACRTVGKFLKLGTVVVFESTVYPGVTEDICGPLLEKISGLRAGKDFTLGYSPERINPGDRQHTLPRITKIVASQDQKTLDRVAETYGAIIPAGIYRAPSIKVAEAAKVIENTQRDLNIALMNELAIICDRLNIRTHDVLKAARTKWNFLPFSPGLVGGHCIGVDPYYLTSLAEQIGYHPQVILAGRRINDGMGAYIAQKIVKLLIKSQKPVSKARVGVLGLTFKENVSDIRNSKVPDIIKELADFGTEILVHDPLADPVALEEEYHLTMVDFKAMTDLDVLVLAVPHQFYLNHPIRDLVNCTKPSAIIVDVKSALNPADIPSPKIYWSL